MQLLRSKLANPVSPDTSSVINFIGRIWEAAKEYWDILRPMRFCVLVWFAFTLLLWFIPQSHDALLALFENVFTTPLDWSSIGVLFLFAALVLFWAFETFYWARFVSRLPARPRRVPFYTPPYLGGAAIGRLNERIPRHLGIFVLLSVWVALIIANKGHFLYEATLSAIMIGLIIAYRFLVLKRRNIANAVHRRVGLNSFVVHPGFVRDLPRLTVSRRAKCLFLSLAIITLAIYLVSGFVRLPLWLAPASAIIWLMFGVWASGHIVGLPPSTKAFLRVNITVFSLLFLAAVSPGLPVIGQLSHLPSPPVIMSVAAAWVFVGTFFLVVPGELLRLPIATLVVLLALVFSLFGRFDNHVLRVPEIQTQTAAKFESTPVAAAFKQWLAIVPKPKGANEPLPIVLVAAAGGASRAAYWTTRVLTEIERKHPGFHKYVFAISSVSGGSLGAVVYNTLLHDIALEGTPGVSSGEDCYPMGKATQTNLVDCGRRVIDHDFLGPTFLTGLYPDLTQRFLPGALLPDRGAALERSWEDAWRDTMPNSTTGLDKPFHSLWQDKDGKLWKYKDGTPIWLPALIINGTSEKTGRRIITSNLVIESDYFTDAIDYFRWVNSKVDISISTAAHNSARFPYIDAAGTLITGGNRMTDRIVDGGYFDNYRAGSIYDLIHQLNSAEINGGQKLKFFIIQITSDPDLVSDQATRNIAWWDALPWRLDIASDVTTPPVALFATGSALGYRATQIVKGLVGADQYAEFRLTDKTETLSWVLSRKAIGSLDNEWENNAPSYQHLGTFMKWN